jgi:hypothetical protein
MGDEMTDPTNDAIQKLAAELPEGFNVELSIERGYGGVELILPGGMAVPVEKDGGGIAGQLLAALRMARDEHIKTNIKHQEPCEVLGVPPAVVLGPAPVSLRRQPKTIPRDIDAKWAEREGYVPMPPIVIRVRPEALARIQYERMSTKQLRIAVSMLEEAGPEFTTSFIDGTGEKHKLLGTTAHAIAFAVLADRLNPPFQPPAKKARKTKP